MHLMHLVATRRFPAGPTLLLAALAGSLTAGDVAPPTVLSTDRANVPSARDAATHARVRPMPS
jgi:hypothetical protein